MPYETQVALWLNIPRLRDGDGIATQKGTVAAFSFDNLPPAWYDALATVAEQAQQLHEDDATQRAILRAHQKAGQ